MLNHKNYSNKIREDTENSVVKIKNVADVIESPLKINIQNSLKSVILKNLSEDKTGFVSRKVNAKINNFSEGKKVGRGLNRPFSQNTNLNNLDIKLNFESEENNLNSNSNKKNDHNFEFRRRINFNSFNNNFPNTTKNSNENNLNLEDHQVKELSLENYIKKLKSNKNKKENQNSNKLFKKLKADQNQSTDLSFILK